MIRVTGTLSIDDGEFEFHFIRASGPGGQNVNKVASAVQLRFDVARSKSLPEDVRARLRVLAANRINTEGVLVITAQRLRTQNRNRADALDRLISLVREAARAPRKRLPTRPTAASRVRRLDQKRRRSNLKLRRAGAGAYDRET